MKANMTDCWFLPITCEAETAEAAQTSTRNNLFQGSVTDISSRQQLTEYQNRHQLRDGPYLVLDDLLGDLGRLGSHGLGGAKASLGGAEPFPERLQGFVELESQNLQLLQLPLPETTEKARSFHHFHFLFLPPLSVNPFYSTFMKLLLNLSPSKASCKWICQTQISLANS